MSGYWKVMLSSVIVLVILSFGVVAEDKADIPFVEGQAHPVATDGEAWMLVTKPATYKTVTERVQIRPASHYFETVPAVFEEKEERILVKPATKKAVLIPAKFKMETVKQLVQEESFRYEVIEPKYVMEDTTIEVSPAYTEPTYRADSFTAVTDKIMIEPGRTEPVKVKCRKKNDGYATISLQEKFTHITRHELDMAGEEGTRSIAAQSKTISVKKLASPAEVKKIVIPAKYEMVERQVLAEPARLEWHDIPAQYTTITKLVMVEPETTRRVDVAARYDTVTRQVLETPEQMVWRNCNTSDCSDMAGLLKRYGSIPGAPASE